MAEEIKKENNGSVVDFSGRYLINSNTIKICFNSNIYKIILYF
jgi:hypothetical protein